MFLLIFLAFLCKCIYIKTREVSTHINIYGTDIMKNCCIAAFGEVMLRLCPPGKKRFAQSFPGSVEATFGGGEANVCASIAMLGGNSRYLTALPDNPVARAFAAQLRGMGCDVSKIHFDKIGRGLLR